MSQQQLMQSRRKRPYSFRGSLANSLSSLLIHKKPKSLDLTSLEVLDQSFTMHNPSNNNTTDSTAGFIQHTTDPNNLKHLPGTYHTIWGNIDKKYISHPPSLLRYLSLDSAEFSCISTISSKTTPAMKGYYKLSELNKTNKRFISDGNKSNPCKAFKKPGKSAKLLTKLKSIFHKNVDPPIINLDSNPSYHETKSVLNTPECVRSLRSIQMSERRARLRRFSQDLFPEEHFLSFDNNDELIGSLTYIIAPCPQKTELDEIIDSIGASQPINQCEAVSSLYTPDTVKTNFSIMEATQKADSNGVHNTPETLTAFRLHALDTDSTIDNSAEKTKPNENDSDDDCSSIFSREIKKMYPFDEKKNNMLVYSLGKNQFHKEMEGGLFQKKVSHEDNNLIELRNSIKVNKHPYNDLSAAYDEPSTTIDDTTIYHTGPSSTITDPDKIQSSTFDNQVVNYLTELIMPESHGMKSESEIISIIDDQVVKSVVTPVLVSNSSEDSHSTLNSIHSPTSGNKNSEDLNHIHAKVIDIDEEIRRIPALRLSSDGKIPSDETKSLQGSIVHQSDYEISKPESLIDTKDGIPKRSPSRLLKDDERGRRLSKQVSKTNQNRASSTDAMKESGRVAHLVNVAEDLVKVKSTPTTPSVSSTPIDAYFKRVSYSGKAGLLSTKDDSDILPLDIVDYSHVAELQATSNNIVRRGDTLPTDLRFSRINYTLNQKTNEQIEIHPDQHYSVSSFKYEDSQLPPNDSSNLERSNMSQVTTLYKNRHYRAKYRQPYLQGYAYEVSSPINQEENKQVFSDQQFPPAFSNYQQPLGGYHVSTPMSKSFSNDKNKINHTPYFQNAQINPHTVNIPSHQLYEDHVEIPQVPKEVRRSINKSISMKRSIELEQNMQYRNSLEYEIPSRGKGKLKYTKVTNYTHQNIMIDGET